MRTDRWLVLRRLGVLWAVPQAAVRSVGGEGSGWSVVLTDRQLRVDDVLGLVHSLRVRPVGLLAPLLPNGVVGMAAIREGAILAVDPGSPPSCLALAAGDE